MQDVESADIRLAGLHIWVHSRQFPEATEYWDANWLHVTVHCGADGADVWVSRPTIHLSELVGWVDGCESMFHTLSGQAELACMEPYLSVSLIMQEHGQIKMQVDITPDNRWQQHLFRFKIDQSYLPDLIAEGREVLRKYPLKNARKG